MDNLPAPFNFAPLPLVAEAEAHLWLTRHEASAARAALRFPDSIIPGSLLFIALANEIDQLVKMEDPLFACCRWPEMVSALVAAELQVAVKSPDGDQRQRQSRSDFDAAVDASVLRAIALYPDTAREGTPLHAALYAEAQRLANEESPLLQDTLWPEWLAANVASALGILPVGVAPSCILPPMGPPAKHCAARRARLASVQTHRARRRRASRLGVGPW